MKFNKTQIIFSELFLVSILLSACGGGGGTSSTSPASPAANTNTVPLTLNVSSDGAAAAGALNKYSVAVTPSTQYVASLTGIVGDADLRVYTDNTFSTLATCAAANTAQSGAAPEDCTVTATGSTLYLAAYGAGTGSSSYRIRVSPKNNATAVSEGTSAYPITLSPNVPYQGTVGPTYSAYSYYKVTPAAGSTISINMTGMQGTQDIDFRVYSSSNFSSGIASCSYTSQAGVLPEDCMLSGGTPYYILVINYGSGVGGPYTLMVDSPNDQANGITAGTTSTLAMNVSNKTTANAGVLNKYSVPVTAGTPYVASLYGITGDADLRVYTDSTYTTLASCAHVNGTDNRPEDCVVTPTDNTLYLGAYGFGAGSNAYSIRVAAQPTGASVNQGTLAAPIVLTPGTSYAGSIAAPYSSYSYYTVTTTGTQNTSINMTGMYGAENLDIRVYSNPNFSSGYQSCGYSALTGILPEECSLPSGTYYILVINYSSSNVGGTFLMTAD